MIKTYHILLHFFGYVSIGSLCICGGLRSSLSITFVTYLALPGVHQPFSRQIFSAIETAEKEIVKKEIAKLNFSP